MISKTRETKENKVGQEEIKPFLVQLTEFIDVVGKYGIGVAMVGMSLLYILFVGPSQKMSINVGLAYVVAFGSLIFGSYVEFMKLKIH